MTRFRVLTYNVLGFSEHEALDIGRRKRLIVSHIEDTAFDVVFLQEIKTLWSKKRDLVHFTESYFRRSDIYKDGCFFVYADQRAPSQNAEGLLTKLPVKRFEFGVLPMGLFGRAYLLVSVDINGHSVHLLTSHLEPPAIGRMITQYGATRATQDRVRIAQLAKLEQIIESLPPTDPVIVGGDFNIEASVPEFAQWIQRLKLRQVLPDSTEKPRKTFATHRSPAFDCGLEFRLDHILYRSGHSAHLAVQREGFTFEKKVGSSDELFYGYLSDHRGVWAEFDVK